MYSKEYPSNSINPDAQTYIKSYGKASKNIKGIQIWGYSLAITNPQKWQMTNKVNFYFSVPVLHNTFVLFYIIHIELFGDRIDSVK